MSIQENVFQTTFEAKLEKIKTILDKNPHPNIAPIKRIHIQGDGNAFGEYDQYNWNLKQYLEQIGPYWLSQQQIYNILNQIVQGYQHLRKFKIVHRDLCLETIFVEQHKDNIIVIKITNFELASVGKTRMSSTAGRLLFQAPEIYQIQNEYNEKCDIYSLGILLYYMCYQQDFHIRQLTKQSLDQFHINLRNSKFSCPQREGITYECKELLEKMIVCDDNNRISWDELYIHNILESNYIIINQIYYIQLAFNNRGQIEFKILNLQKNEYCCQEQIFSYGAILNQLIQFGYVKYVGISINNLNQIQEILNNPNFQLLDIKQQIIMDDNLQNIIHQIQQYFPKDIITKDKLLTEINNLVQPKSNSSINSNTQKIKILSKQTINPEQQNQSFQHATQIPTAVNVQPQQQNLSNILPVQNYNQNDEVDVFGLQIGDQQQEQNNQQFNKNFTNQFSNNNQQNSNFQDNKFKKQLDQPITNNFKTNFSTNGQKASVPAGQVIQQELNNNNFQQGSQNFSKQLPSQSTNPPQFTNFQIPKPINNQTTNLLPFQKAQSSISTFLNSQMPKPSDNQTTNPPLFQNSQIPKPTDYQTTNSPFQNPQIPQPKDNQASFNVFQSQKQPSSSQNPPIQFSNQRQSNFSSVQFSQKQNSAIQPPINQNQPVQQQQIQNQSVQQQQVQNQSVQQQQFQNLSSFPTNSNSGKPFNNFEQNKFQPNSQASFTSQFKGTNQNPIMPNLQNEKNGVFDSQRMRQTQSSNTQYTREYQEWQSLTVKTQNQLEQSSNFIDYKNIYICLYYLNKYLIQKINTNNQNLNRENEERAQKYNFLKENNFSQSVPNLEKANEQLVKQIDLSKQYIQNKEKDETLKNYLRQLFSFEIDMKKKYIF